MVVPDVARCNARKGWYQAAGDEAKGLIDYSVYELGMTAMGPNQSSLICCGKDQGKSIVDVQRVVKLVPQVFSASFFIRFTFFLILLETPCRGGLQLM